MPMLLQLKTFLFTLFANMRILHTQFLDSFRSVALNIRALFTMGCIWGYLYFYFGNYAQSERCIHNT